MSQVWKTFNKQGRSFRVSNYGQVQKLLVDKNRYVDCFISYSVRGHPRVNFRYGGSNRPIQVNRLVADAFLGKSEFRLIHKDGDKLNCSVANLSYDTITYLRNMHISLDPTLLPWIARYKDEYVGHYQTRADAKLAVEAHTELLRAELSRVKKPMPASLESRSRGFDKPKYKDGIHEYAYNHYLVKEQGAVVEYFTSRQDAEEYIDIFCR